MAVLARAADHPRIGRAAQQLRLRALVGAEGLARVGRRRRVALLAEVWARREEHGLVVRAVRLVAIEAVLAHRRVFPQERAALFGVARVAGVVHSVAAEQRACGRAVRAVAIGTAHLAL